MRATENLEAKHGADDALDGSMILFDDVVEVLHLRQFDRRTGIVPNGVDGSGVGATLVDGELVRRPSSTVVPIKFRYARCE